MTDFLKSKFVGESQNLPELYHKSLEDSAWYFYSAKSGIELSVQQEYTKYQQLWISMEKICYITDRNEDIFTLQLNFPMLPNILHYNLVKQLEKDSPKVPLDEIKGFLLETAFLIISANLKRSLFLHLTIMQNLPFRWNHFLLKKVSCLVLLHR